MWDQVTTSQRSDRTTAQRSDRDAIDHMSDEYTEGLQAAEAKLMKYFELLKDSPIYYTVVALDPSLRLHWFEDKWGGYDQNAWLKIAKRKFRDLFDHYAVAIATEAPPAIATLPTEVLETEDEAVDSEQAYRIFGGLSSDYLNKKKRKRTGSVSRMVDESTRYM
jgi:hypothetical protein